MVLSNGAFLKANMKNCKSVALHFLEDRVLKSVECRWKHSMIAKEMEKILAFECKYAEGVEKRTHIEL